MKINNSQEDCSLIEDWRDWWNTVQKSVKTSNKVVETSVVQKITNATKSNYY